MVHLEVDVCVVVRRPGCFDAVAPPSLEVGWKRIISAGTYEEVAAVVKEEIFKIGVSA